MSDESAKPPPKVSLLDSFLEIDAMTKGPPTLKQMGDNLRNYPLMVACFAGLGLLWTSNYVGAKIAAVLWTVWLLWFAVFTVVQSSFLVLMVTVDVLNRVPWFHREFRRSGSLLTALLGAMSTAFFFSSVFVAMSLYGALRS